ncbi:hypothetical protein RBH29_10335 [Herbivorax sp. ANBcel31]|uniref:hypothetical protein n=1 Tax=Herbivorax sp. ANBcel31 TaxID=3069754 RepID=UPI0027B181CA|nr:hypothetical protein [Herbivorax sp. ANBcel31]MDQ2086822.1 hypothetical protein [Herbivorax sp. ANBcel31]
MKSKEEFYNVVQEIRSILKDPKNLKCSCPKIKCEWHGKCQECVTFHRYYKDHVPNCFQQFINDKIKAIAQIGELNVVEKEKTPPEYWDYVKERDKE